MVVPDTLSEEEDEETPPLLDQEQMDTDFHPHLFPDKHVGVTFASSCFEDALQLHDLVDCMVPTLNLPLVAVEEVSHPVLDILVTTSMNRMLQSAQTVWSIPATCQPISKKTNSTRVYMNGSLTFIHSLCKFTNGGCCQYRFRSGQTHSTPADREERKTDTPVRKVFLSSSLGIGVANY